MNILDMIKNEKVEWKSVWEVTIWDKKFNSVENYKQTNVDKYKYYLAKDVEKLIVENGDIKILTTNISEKYTNIELVENDIIDSEVICIPWGGNPVVQYYKGKFITTDNRIARSNNRNYLNTKYLYYYFLEKLELIKSFYRGSGIKHPEMKKILDLRIPIPSIEIQEKIVKTLDKFTKYVTELQAELHSREKQYEFYREKLLSEKNITKLMSKLSFDEKDNLLNITTLGDIGFFTRGNGLQKKDFVEKGFPVVHYGEIYTKYSFSIDKVYTYTDEITFSKLRKAQRNDILIATTSENFEDVGKCVVWLGEEEIGFSGDMYSYRTTQNPKYIAYLFQTNLFRKFKESKVSGTKVIRLHSNELEKMRVVIPSLKIQDKIVKILDSFQESISNTKGLLPKEIELRQKQYEYYREKLLTFDVEYDNTHTHTHTLISREFFELLVSLENQVKKYKLEEIAGVFDVITDYTAAGSFKSIAQNVQYYNDINFAQLIRTKDIKSNFKNNDFVYVDKNAYKFLYRVNLEKESIVLPNIGNCGEVYIIDKKNLPHEYNVLGPNAILLRSNSVINKYLYYLFLGKEFQIKLSKITSNTGQSKFNKTDLKKIKIPIPSIEIQEKIVKTLDKFTKYVTELQTELYSREKQYEYYREQLFNFGD